MRPGVWMGECLRWYLTRARHPLKGYITGHYWWLFAKLRVWVRYDDDAVMNLSLGEYIQQRIFFDSYYERPLIEWLKHSLAENDIVWDVGANVGAVTIVAARHCRRVVAFEPDPRSFAHLRQHVEVNGIDNVELVNAALAETSGETALAQGGETNTGMSSMVPAGAAAANVVSVRTVTADDFLVANPTLSPTVIKIDVEGAEHRVVAGAVELLRTTRPKAIIFEDRRASDGGPSNRQLLAGFAAAGYRIEPFAASSEEAGDGMFNYIATPCPRP